MPHICPRPCSRLATAAVFIAIGVVQIVVGIILLRSKYVYLLAGPDFWTSTCNIAVGCLLGLSASVWKQSVKQRSAKDDIRRNLLMALLFSSLMINSTTLGIYLLGKGNALLSIRLENGLKDDPSSFDREVLAYAYVTSVCCPIICIVIAMVSMIESFFNHVAKKSLEMKTPPDGLEKEHAQPLRWIYTPELLDKSKKKSRDHILSSSSESADEDESRGVSVTRKSSYSEKDIQLVLNRMAQGKRDSILSDSAIMLRQMDLLRRSRGEKLRRDGSYTGPILPRSKKNYLDLKCPKDSVRCEDSTRHEDLPPSRAKKHPSDSETKYANYAKHKQLETSEKLLNEYRQAASKLAHHYPSMYKKFRETLKNASAVDGTVSSYASDVSDNEIGNTADGVNKKSEKLSEAEHNSIPTDFQRKNQEYSATPNGNREYKRHNTSEDTASSSNDYFSPDKSDFGGDSTFNVSKDSEAEEIIRVNMKHSFAAKLSRMLKPVDNPVVGSEVPQAHYVRKYSDDSGFGNAESNSFTGAENNEDLEEMAGLSSLRKNGSSIGEDLKVRNKETKQEYPTVGTQSMKKFDLNKMVAMESISEEPSIEQQSKIDPVSDRGDLHNKGAIPKVWKGHLRNKSLSCIEPGRSRHMNYDGNMSAKIFTPKRKRATSSKALKNVWSVAASGNQRDFLDQVVDGDSLIGLSEEELIARQLRTRSIRKEIQKRMKAEVAPM